MRLDQAFSDSFTRFPDSPAIIEGNRACTYSQLHARVERLAGALASRGVSSGGHVVYVSANSAVFAELTLACSRIGAVCEIHNIRLSDQTLLELIARSGASLAVLSADAWDRLGPHLPSSGSIETTVVFGHEEDLLDDAIPYEEFLEGAPAPPNQKPADDEDPVLMMFTSGTTGTPKGVLFSHRAIANRIAIDVESMGFSSGDSMLFVLPFFHTTCMSVFAVLSAGGTAVIGNSSDPRSIMETVNRYGITRIGLVPYHMRSLCSYVEEHGLTADTLELIIYGAEPASPDLIERCRDLLGCKLLQGYGMTEMASTVTILTPEDHEKRELLSMVGRPVPRTQVRIVNDEGLPCREGVVGEIQVKSPCAMSGYWKNAAASQEVMQDGWCSTQDMGYVDSDGYLTLSGRKNDLVVSGGENVYPSEVASCIESMGSFIADVAVTGVPDERWGESLAAFVVLEPGASVTEQDIQDYCTLQLGGFKKPRRVIFVDDLKRLVSGKVPKERLDELIALLKEDSPD